MTHGSAGQDVYSHPQPLNIYCLLILNCQRTKGTKMTPDKQKVERIGKYETELTEIENYVKENKINENKSKIDAFMADFFQFVGVYSYKFQKSPPYKKLIRLYEDDMFHIRMNEIISICRGLLENLKK